MFLKAKILWIHTATADNGSQYLSMEFKEGTVAQCWDRKLWSELYFAYEEEREIGVTLSASYGKEDQVYKHIVGVRKI
jgi:hypothetical protein